MGSQHASRACTAPCCSCVNLQPLSHLQLRQIAREGWPVWKLGKHAPQRGIMQVPVRAGGGRALHVICKAAAWHPPARAQARTRQCNIPAGSPPAMHREMCGASSLRAPCLPLHSRLACAAQSSTAAPAGMPRAHTTAHATARSGRAQAPPLWAAGKGGSRTGGTGLGECRVRPLTTTCNGM